MAKSRARKFAELLDGSDNVKSARLGNATSTVDGATDTNLASVADNDLLAYDSTSGKWTNQSASEAGIVSEVVGDTSPQLGGDLDVGGNKIVSSSNGNVIIEPNGTGDFLINKTAVGLSTAGFEHRDNGLTGVTRNGGNPLAVTRLTDDGDLTSWYKGGTEVAKVAVSNTDNISFSAMQAAGAGLLFWGANGTDPVISPMKQGANADNQVELGRSNIRFKKFHLAEWGTAPAGTVLQVKSTTGTGVASYNNSSWNTLSSLSITPKSTSSKILVISTITFGGGTIQASWNGYLARMRRGNVTIAKGTSTASNQTSESTYGGLSYKVYHRTEPHTQQFLDSPSTTGAVTYSMQVARTTYAGGTIQFNQPSNRSTQYTGSGVTTLTLMEIAG